MSTDVPSRRDDLGRLSRAFDAACDELGISLSALDVPKREQLVKRAMKLAHAGDALSEKKAPTTA